MTIDERLALLADITHENSEGIRDLLATSKEHTKQLEVDGQYIKQLAMIVHEQHAEIQKMTNGIQALVETVAQHETRIDRIE